MPLNISFRISHLILISLHILPLMMLFELQDIIKSLTRGSDAFNILDHVLFTSGRTRCTKLGMSSNLKDLFQQTNFSIFARIYLNYNSFYVSYINLNECMYVTSLLLVDLQSYSSHHESKNVF